MASSKDCETFVYIAKLTEQAEHYDELVEAMKKVAKLGLEPTGEEQNLLSIGYKNVVGSRRSWRILSSIEQKGEAKGKKKREEDQSVQAEGRVRALHHLCKSSPDTVKTISIIPSKEYVNI